MSDTVTVRYDLSPANVEGQIREKLITLGWTPPRAALPRGEYPPLPGAPSLGLVQYTGVEMRAYVDADRTARWGINVAPAAQSTQGGDRS